MNASKHLKALFFLTLVTFCLPWFTYNANVMGYRHGIVFLKWFLIPMLMLALCLFWPKKSVAMIILGELVQIVNFAELACALGLWQQVCNIKSGFQWLEGIRTAQPGYWAAVCFFVLLFLNYQVELFNDDRKEAGSGRNRSCEKI